MTRRPPQPAAVAATVSLAVVCCHFNWGQFMRPRQNLMRFLRQQSAVPVFGVEAYLDQPFTRRLSGWTQVQAGPNQILWQKEALLNLAAARVPARFNAIAWIDTDLYFENADWLAQTEALLQHFPAVQPFSEAVWTKRDGREMLRRPAYGTGLAPSHPGFALALRRELWPLPWHWILGSGDKHVCAGQSQMAATPGRVWHEWHGDRERRRFGDRYEMLAGADPRELVHLADNGLATWNDSVPAGIRENVANYFQERREDG